MLTWRTMNFAKVIGNHKKERQSGAISPGNERRFESLGEVLLVDGLSLK